MKKILFLVILLVGAGYYYWPYHTTSTVRDALNTSDSASLDKIINWPALKTSFTEQVKPMVWEAMRKQFGPKVTQVAAAVPFDEVLDKVLEEEASSTGMVRMTKGKLAFSEAQQLGFDSRTWDGLTNFDAKFSGSEAQFHFQLQGMDGWKLMNVKLGPKDTEAILTRYQEAFTVRANQPKPGGQAPLKAVLNPEPKKESWLKGYQNPLDKRPANDRRSPTDGGGLR